MNGKLVVNAMEAGIKVEQFADKVKFVK